LKTIWTIAQKDMKEAFQKRSTYVYVVMMLFISFPTYVGGLGNAIRSLGDQGVATAQTIDVIQRFIDSTAYTQPLTLAMLFCTYLCAYAVILEKAKRTMESLLATPASLRQVWFGKNLAVALPSMLVTLLILIAAIVTLNLALIVPRTGTFILPSIVPMLTVLVILPLLVLSVVSLVSVLQLTLSNPRLANFAFILVFFGFYVLTVANSLVTWNFALIYLIALAILSASNVLAGRLLTKERVVLTSKALG
jgi:ABC-2 type transport system permease protein